MTDPPVVLRRPAHARLPTRGSALRVALVDDDEVTTRGLTAMLRPHQEQVELARLTRPLSQPIDIALYDPMLPRPNGRPTLAQLSADPRIRKVAIFTWNLQPFQAAGLMGQGVSACLSKGMRSGELVEALLTVDAGGQLVAPGADHRREPARNQAEHGEVLTTREAEMLSLISSGLSNVEIARSLNLSVNTVKSYIRSCYRKIDVDSRSKAVLWGLSHGYSDGGPAAAGTVLPQR